MVVRFQPPPASGMEYQPGGRGIGDAAEHVLVRVGISLPWKQRPSPTLPAVEVTVVLKQGDQPALPLSQIVEPGNPSTARRQCRRVAVGSSTADRRLR